MIPFHNQYPIDNHGLVFPQITVPSDNVEEIELSNDVVNYIKLHGSSNWVDEKNNELMIIGHEKIQKIQSFNCLIKMLAAAKNSYQNRMPNF